MVYLTLCLACLIGADPAKESQTDAIAAYRKLVPQAGRDAEAQVRLALWCEAHGLTSERRKHLTIAVLADPSHRLAHGLLGQVQDGRTWRSPEDVAARVRGDAERATLREQYRARRETLVDTAESHRQLASWCLENGLEAEAKVHLSAVVRIDPKREEAWKDLGFRKVNGRWHHPEETAWVKAELEAMRRADSKWRPLLQRWKSQLGQKAKRAQAEASLAEVSDPLAAGPVLRVFGPGTLAEQERAVEILARLDGLAASQGLVSLAVSSSYDRVRALASDRLAARDPREFAGLLIGMFREPIKYEVKPVGGPGSPGELYIQGERMNARHFYQAPASPVTLQPGDSIGFDEFGLPVASRIFGYALMPVAAGIDPRYMGAPDLTGAGDVLGKTSLGAAGRKLGAQMEQNQNNNAAIGMRMEYIGSFGVVPMPLYDQLPVGQFMLRAQRQAAASQEQLRADVAELDRFNKGIRQLNDRVDLALKTALNETGNLDRSGWLKWLSKLTGTSSAPIVPTLAEKRYTTAEPASSGDVPGPAVSLPALIRGTPIWTIDGLRPVEQVQPGDLVLTQDLATGAMAFDPALAIRLPRQSPALKLSLGDTTITASGLERFWVSGRGWVMARDLKAGDLLRAIDGSARVTGVESVEAAPQHHLEVAGGRGIFVSARGLLAQDGHVSKPVIVPFDSPIEPRR